MVRPNVRTVLLATALWGCKDTTGESPLVGLANRLYLDGDWAWTDSVGYSGYVPDGDSASHHGWYVVSGEAVLEAVDSTDVETYAMEAVAQLFHVDSVGDREVARWTVTEIEFSDTVYVESDSIFGLSVEAIPPQASPTTNEVRWTFDHRQLWCTNWLTDSIPPGNGDNCRTAVRWLRTGAAPDTVGGR